MSDFADTRLDLADHGHTALRARIGVDVEPVGAPLTVTLDAPPEEIEALVDVGDQGLLRRQAQAYRGQDPRDLLPQGFGVGLRAQMTRHQSSAYRIKPVVGQTLTTTLGPLVGR